MQISLGDSCLQPARFFLSQAEKKQHPLSESNSFQVHKPQSKKIAPLNTNEYQTFCQKYFGFPIGHSPNDNANEVLSERELETYLLSYLTYVERHLGPDTVFRWFDEYSETYSAENLLRLRIQVLQEKLDSYLYESKETL